MRVDVRGLPKIETKSRNVKRCVRAILIRGELQAELTRALAVEAAARGALTGGQKAEMERIINGKAWTT